MSEMTIRPATEADAQLVFDLICELATYEKLRDEVVGTAEILRASLFDRGDAEALIVEDEAGAAVGYAIFYTTFSTFECRSGIWLEDLYVRPERRQGGIGLRVMEHLADLALERGHRRLEWVALDWNEPALNFYEKLGAARLDNWVIHRLEVPGMQTLAANDSPPDPLRRRSDPATRGLVGLAAWRWDEERTGPSGAGARGRDG